jgi:hypothetical protein
VPRPPTPLCQGSCARGGSVDSHRGMEVEPTERGDALLAAHCFSLDPDAPTARERLDAALGPDLARKLVFALAGTHIRDPATATLGARAVFAA